MGCQNEHWKGVLQEVLAKDLFAMLLLVSPAEAQVPRLRWVSLLHWRTVLTVFSSLQFPFLTTQFSSPPTFLPIHSTSHFGSSSGTRLLRMTSTPRPLPRARHPFPPLPLLSPKPLALQCPGTHQAFACQFPAAGMAPSLLCNKHVQVTLFSKEVFPRAASLELWARACPLAFLGQHINTIFPAYHDQA